MSLEKEVQAKAAKWLSSNIDNETRNAIEKLKQNPEQLTEAFYKDLNFGTGGLRGIMGVGSNRMNKYTVGMATQGLANYLKQSFPNQEIKVAIAHDSRNNSRFFAETTANVLSANGIRVFLFEELRPTPELSFAIRELGCQSGIVLTASHNPKEYNGYKAYWEDGGQLTPPHDKNVIAEVNKIGSIDEVNFEGKAELIESIGENIDRKYLDLVKSLSLDPEVIKKHHDVPIVFSSIHGTGITLIPRCLKELGFTNVNVVEAQKEPNGDFPTVEYPNPEEAEALKLALEEAKKVDAELVMATDPDADRVGIAVKNNNGDFELLNGNQTGAILMYYVLMNYGKQRGFKGNEFVVKTIVTSELMDDIAKHFGVKCYNTLTGFKYIAALIKELEGKEKFIVGGEESYGYLIGDFVRDKDAVASSVMLAEIVAYTKSKGKSVYDLLMDIYQEIGFYKERLISLTKKGKSGAEEIQTLMADFRQNPPKSLAGHKVVKQLDYQTGKAVELESGLEEKLEFPKSNVLQFITEEGYKISCRPSGTEPKIKFYISVNEKLSNKESFVALDTKMGEVIDDIANALTS